MATTVSAQLALDTPLLHFIFFLTKTIKAGAGPLFQVLRQKYSVSTSRDPTFDKVGPTHPNTDIQVPQEHRRNLFWYQSTSRVAGQSNE